MQAFWNNQTWNHQKPEKQLSDTQNLCVWQLVFWLLVVSSNYFTKFHDFPMIIQVFSNSMIFPRMELFIWFFRFSMISSACGNPAYVTYIYWYLSEPVPIHIKVGELL